MSPTLRLINFVMMNGNRKLGLISLRKADKSGYLKFLLIFTLAIFFVVNGKDKSNKCKAQAA